MLSYGRYRVIVHNIIIYEKKINEKTKTKKQNNKNRNFFRLKREMSSFLTKTHLNKTVGLPANITKNEIEVIPQK